MNTELTCDQKCERFDRAGALYIVCSQMHSGQWSRGYRLLSKLRTLWQYEPGLSVQNCRPETETQRDYVRRWFGLARRGELREPL